MPTTPDDNPFASPTSDASDDPVVADEVWREGELLIARIGAELPDRCLGCGAPGVWRGTYQLSPPGKQTKEKDPYTLRERLVGYFVVLPVAIIGIAGVAWAFSSAGPLLPELPDIGILDEIFFLVLFSAIVLIPHSWHRNGKSMVQLRYSLCRLHRGYSRASASITAGMYCLIIIMMSNPLLEELGFEVDVSIYFRVLIPLLFVGLIVNRFTVTCEISQQRHDGYCEIKGPGKKFLDTLPTGPGGDGNPSGEA